MDLPDPSGPEVVGQGREPRAVRSRRRHRVVSGGALPGCRAARRRRSVVLALVAGGLWYAGPSRPRWRRHGSGGHRRGQRRTDPGRDRPRSLACPRPTTCGRPSRRRSTRTSPPAGTCCSSCRWPTTARAAAHRRGDRAADRCQPGPHRRRSVRRHQRRRRAQPRRPDRGVRATDRAVPAGARRHPRPSVVLLVAEEQGRHPRLERIPMDALGPYWDEARHAACRTADAARDVTAAVGRAVRARRAQPTTATLTVSAVISFHDAAGFAAVVTGPAVAMGGGGRRGRRRRVDPFGADALERRDLRAYRTPPVTAAAAPPYRVDLPQETAAGQGAPRRRLRRRVDGPGQRPVQRRRTRTG